MEFSIEKLYENFEEIKITLTDKPNYAVFLCGIDTEGMKIANAVVGDERTVLFMLWRLASDNPDLKLLLKQLNDMLEGENNGK